MTRTCRVGQGVFTAGVAAFLVVGCGGDDRSEQPDPSPSAAATSSAPPAEPAATSTPTPDPRTFTLVATGDVLLHERLWAEARRDATGGAEMNFGPQLANIAPVVAAADLAVCHLEVPLAPAGGPYQGYPAFSGPPQIADALAATGYDACTTASNHTFDQGGEGIDRTLATLDAAGIAHTGSARSPKEDAGITMLDVPGGSGPVKVALLSYTYGFNGIPYPDGQTWRANQIDRAAILADSARARSEGADVVVVALHWGTEYQHDPNEQQLRLAPKLISSPDIDLLLGHHAHVVQPVQNIGGEWVVYGMGNLMANHAEPEGPKSEGLLTSFTFTENPKTGAFTVTEAGYLPLYQTYEPPVEVLAVPTALASGDVGTAGAARLRAALSRTKTVVESRGGAGDGLTMIGGG